MKLSRHNGRKGKDGAYKVSHNDRKFDLDNAEHIDQDKAKANIYWDCYQGYYSELLIPREDGEIPASFLDVEKLYYKEHYSEYCEKQSERNHKARHYDRDRTPEDLRKDVRTCPEESILQIGNKDEAVSPDVLAAIAQEYFEEFDKRFGQNIHILNWSLHLDEATPHIHFVSHHETYFRSYMTKANKLKSAEALKVLNKKLAKSENRLKEIDKLYIHLYEDNVSGKISDDKFVMMAKSYEGEQIELQESIKKLREDISSQESQIDNLNHFIELVNKNINIEKLDEYVLHEMVKAIYIEAPNKSSGKRTQKVHIQYDLVGFIPLNELLQTKEMA